MNDCPNGELRDLLPELLHERLDASSRPVVQSHVDGCADCQAELAFLGAARATLGRTPALDVAAIVRAVPAYRASARRSWVGWRTAAAVTLLAAGGSSVALLQRDRAPLVSDSVAVSTSTPMSGRGDSVPAVAAVPDSPSPVAAPRSSKSANGRLTQGRELAMAGGNVHELSDAELATLLADLETLDGVPVADVEPPAVTPVAPARGEP